MSGLAYALKISAWANARQEGVFLPYPEPPPETFGQRLKRLAKANGYTNRALAELTGAHETTVARWMMGRVPEPDSLVVLTRVLRVSLDYLLHGNGGDTPAAEAKFPPRDPLPKLDVRGPRKRRRSGEA